MQSLNSSTVIGAPVAPGVIRPSYDRETLQASVVHLGLGAFQRAHQAMVFDRLLHAGDRRWAVLGVAMRSTTLADDLQAQDGLYTVQVASADGLAWHIPGSLVETCVAAREPSAVIAAIAAPATRWITLTVTEKGYGAPLAELLVGGLAARFEAGLGGLTIASCDNLSDNGRRLQRLCVDTAARKNQALADWIASRCAFPNSMVDRIVPASTPDQRDAAAQALGLVDACALATEGFWEWVIEDRLSDPSDAQALRSAGVNVVDDVTVFEEAKLRMLNGSHTAIAVLGAVQGWATVAEGLQQPAVRAFIERLMTDVVMPHLQRPGLREYRDALLARFANPALHHKVHQIATDSSLKIPLRWLPTLRDGLRQGQDLEPLAFAAAVWMRYLTAVDERGQAYALSDPQAALLQSIVQSHAGDVPATVKALLALESIWGRDVGQHTPFRRRVTDWLTRIESSGSQAALAMLLAAPHVPR